MYGLVDMNDLAQAKPKYKVGQKVRIVKSGREVGGSAHGADIGDVFKIECIEDNDAVFVGDWYLWPSEFEPVFSHGDRVRVTACNGFFAAGDEGVVSYQGAHSVYVKRGEYQRTGFPIEASKLEWLGAEPDCAERKVEQDNDETVTFSGVIKDDNSEMSWSFNDFTISFPSADQPCIVALIAKDGKPRPSSYPYVHTSLVSATTEAERLARDNPGQEFAVYQRVTGRKAEARVEMKEVA